MTCFHSPKYCILHVVNLNSYIVLLLNINEKSYNSYNAAEVCVFVKDDLEDRSKKFHEKKRKLWKNLIKEQKVAGVLK